MEKVAMEMSKEKETKERRGKERERKRKGEERKNTLLEKISADTLENLCVNESSSDSTEAVNSADEASLVIYSRYRRKHVRSCVV